MYLSQVSICLSTQKDKRWLLLSILFFANLFIVIAFLSTNSAFQKIKMPEGWDAFDTLYVYKTVTITGLFGTIFTGKLIPKFEIRKLYCCGLLISAFSSLLFIFITKLTDRFDFLMAAILLRIFQGIGGFIVYTTSFVLTLNYLAKSNSIPLGLCAMEIAHILPLNLGVYITDIIYDVFGFQFEFIFIFTGLITNAIFVVFSMTDIKSRESQKPIAKILTYTKLFKILDVWFIFLIYLLLSTTFHFLEFKLPAVLKSLQYHPNEIRYFFTINHLILTVSIFFFAIISIRTKCVNFLMYIGLSLNPAALFAASFAAIGSENSSIAIIIGTILMQISIAALVGNLFKKLIKIVTKRNKYPSNSQTAGMCAGFFSLAYVFGSLIGNVLAYLARENIDFTKITMLFAFISTVFFLYFNIFYIGPRIYSKGL